MKNHFKTSDQHNIYQMSEEERIDWSLKCCEVRYTLMALYIICIFLQRYNIFLLCVICKW